MLNAILHDLYTCIQNFKVLSEMINNHGRRKGQKYLKIKLILILIPLTIKK